MLVQDDNCFLASSLLFLAFLAKLVDTVSSS
jgi:hypothetical protein